MDAPVIGGFQGLRRAFDIAAGSPRQSTDGGVFQLFGDALHGLEIALGGIRKPGLDHIHAQFLEHSCDAQFFLQSHGGARRLFAVA